MAIDCFMQLDGIKGESQDANFKGWIQVQSLQWGLANKSSVAFGTGSGAGKVSLADFAITKLVDTASSRLFLNCCSGTHIAKGAIAVNKVGGGTGPNTFLQFQLAEIFITSINLAVATEFPSEIVTFSYRTINYSYFAQGADGNLTASGVAGWDISKNTRL